MLHNLMGSCEVKMHLPDHAHMVSQKKAKQVYFPSISTQYRKHIIIGTQCCTNQASKHAFSSLQTFLCMTACY